jgi:N-acyl-L-homoserine lactone synthetase
VDARARADAAPGERAHDPLVPSFVGAKHDAVIPQVESSLFEGRDVGELAVGIVAVGQEVIPGLEDEHQGYLLLRGNVYAREKRYMPIGDLNHDGTETDPDDLRSIHFVLLENAPGGARVVGTMRLIIKGSGDVDPLPIERHYPESFPVSGAPAFSAEVSRLICRHEHPRVQTRLKWPLFSAGVTYLLERGLGPVYGAVDEHLNLGLQRDGVPVTALGAARYVPEYNAVKAPIRIDLDGLARRIDSTERELVDAMHVLDNAFVYSRVRVPVLRVPVQGRAPDAEVEVIA